MPNKPQQKRAHGENKPTHTAQETGDQRPKQGTLAFQGKGTLLQQVI